MMLHIGLPRTVALRWDVSTRNLLLKLISSVNGHAHLNTLVLDSVSRSVAELSIGSFNWMSISDSHLQSYELRYRFII